MGAAFSVNVEIATAKTLANFVKETAMKLFNTESALNTSSRRSFYPPAPVIVLQEANNKFCYRYINAACLK